MKKSLVAAMFAVMMISLVGCGKASEPKTIETTEVVEEVTEATEAVEAATEVEAQDEVADDDVAEKPVVDEEPVAEPYSYADVNQTMYAQSTVNVRSLPEQSGEKLGSLSTNQEVTVTGQCNETGWYRISYNGGEGFVSNSYLGSEKVVVKSKSSSATQSTSQAPTQTESQPAQEAPAEPEKQPGEVDTSNAVTTDQVLAPGETLTPDSYGCPWCGYTTTSYDEYHNHLIEEGVAGLQ